MRRISSIALVGIVKTSRTMKCNISKFLIFLICLSASHSMLQAKSYTKLHNQGSSVYWESSFPKEVVGVKLTVQYTPLSDSEKAVTQSRYFAANEAITYPFESGGKQSDFGNGAFKWELSLIVGGMNLLEPVAHSEGVEVKQDENGRNVQQFAGAESLINAHRNIDASAKVTSGFFRVMNGSVLDFGLAENESLKDSNK